MAICMATVSACDGGTEPEDSGGNGGDSNPSGGRSADGGGPTGGTVSDGGAGGEGGEGGANGELPLPESVVIDDFESGLGDWTLFGNASTAANPGGGTALFVEQTTAECGSSTISQTLTVPANAGALRYSVWGSGFSDLNGATQAWVTVDGWLGLYASMPAEPSGVSFCIPAELQGASVPLAITVRTQGDCGSPLAVQFYVDDITWDADASGCIELSSPD